MSETVGSDSAAGRGGRSGGDAAGAPRARTAADRNAANASNGGNGSHATNTTEAYAFACMNCGFGWEQAFEIEHHADPAGHPYITYLADGVRVPSPLTRPSCPDCDGHHVRIMRAGQVSGVTARWAVPRGERGVHRTRHWSVLHFLHRRHGEAGSA